MNVKSIFKGNKQAIILKSFIMIFAFLTVAIFGPVVFQGSDECLAAERITGSFSELVKKASPSVVNVSIVKTAQTEEQFSSPFGDNDPFNQFFNRFYGDQMPKNYKQRGLGTGFIIDKEGYILTNNHVVEGADEIKVILSDKKEFTAKVIGLDSKTDLALIKIDGAKDLVPLALGDSDKMEVGDLVVAIGNPFGFDNTVTAGIVSAKYRRQLGTASYEDYIQTDAAINQGNSGGPLINIDGEVIGINSNMWSETGGSVGIGFAIPINMAKDLLPQLKKGKIIRGWLGVTIQQITPDLQDKLDLKDTKGALVSDVTEGGPAKKAGIETGDVIVSFDGKEINDANELPLIVAATAVGKTAKIEIIRNGNKRTLDIKVGELKDEEEKSYQKKESGNSSDNKLGFTVGDITPEMAREYNLTEKSGVIILQVDGVSLAEEVGLQPGDIVVEIDMEKITNTNQFNKKIKGYKAGVTILLLVKREGSSLFLTLKVEK
jgi:serine protease Do